MTATQTISPDSFRVTLSSIGYACITLDLRQRVISMNQLAEKITNWPSPDAVGRKLSEIITLVDKTTREPIAYTFDLGQVDGQAVGLPPDLILLNQKGQTIGMGGEDPPIIESPDSRQGTFLIFRDLTQGTHTEADLQRKSLDLNMRIKGITCLYAISELLQKQGVSLADILKGIVSLIPSAWQYPDITCARITLDERQYGTDNFKVTPWKLACQIHVNNTVSGTAEVYYQEHKPAAHEGPFLREERTLLNVITEHVEKVVERKRTEAELAQARKYEAEIGWKIQQTLLLGTPPNDMPGLQMAALTIPSQSVDGDFYDFFKHSDHCIDLVIGDVMGKGIPGALLGAGTKNHFLRANSQLAASPTELPTPEKIVQFVHDKMVRELIGLHTFVTLCYARFDINQMRLMLVDCGHTKTIHYQRATGKYNLLQSLNVPLGFNQEEIYRQLTVPVAVGDILFFYSDGITEARNEAGHFFGVERLVDCIQQHAHLTSEELVNYVYKDVAGFSHSRTFDDDLTCTAVKFSTEEALPVASETIDITSELDQLDAVRHFVHHFNRKHVRPALAEEAVWELELALHEVASNIMRHAYHGHQGHKIRVESELFADRLIFRFVHQGEAFDLTTEMKSLDRNHKKGFGVFLIDQCVDQHIYTRDRDGLNRIWLVKYR